MSQGYFLNSEIFPLIKKQSLDHQENLVKSKTSERQKGKRAKGHSDVESNK